MVELETYRGQCHCGRVQFAISAVIKELTTCDCSICRKKNALMVKVHDSEFELNAGKNDLNLYQFHTHTAKHYFCQRCGIYTFHRKRVTPDFYGINVYCLEEFNISRFPVRTTVGAAME